MEAKISRRKMCGIKTEVHVIATQETTEIGVIAHEMGEYQNLPTIIFHAMYPSFRE